MKYTVMHGAEITEFDTVGSAATYVAENIPEEVYDDMLDECYGQIDICGVKYAASVALYRVDRVAYRCGYNDYCDSLYCDMVYEMDKLEEGGTVEFYGYTVTCEGDEEE